MIQKIFLAALLAAFLPRAAVADELVLERPIARNAVSLHVLSLGARSLSVEYERFVLPPKLSVAAGFGIRDNAGGEYEAMTVAAGAEVRYWFSGRAVWSRLGPGNMAGPYVAGRLDLARTSTRDDVLDESLGSTVTVAESIAAGYRFVAFRRLEITPSLGVSVRTEIDTSGRLSPWTRGAAVAGLTLGWLF